MTEDHLSMIRGLTLFILCIASALLVLQPHDSPIPALIGVVGVIAGRYWMGVDEDREREKRKP